MGGGREVRVPRYSGFGSRCPLVADTKLGTGFLDRNLSSFSLTLTDLFVVFFSFLCLLFCCCFVCFAWCVCVLSLIHI